MPKLTTTAVRKWSILELLYTPSKTFKKVHTNIKQQQNSKILRLIVLKWKTKSGKMYKLLRTGGDCEGVFTAFLFLHGKRKQSLVKLIIYINVCVCVLPCKSRATHNNNTNNRFLCFKHFFYISSISNPWTNVRAANSSVKHSPVFQALLYCYMFGQQLQHRRARGNTKEQPDTSNKITIGLNLIAHRDNITLQCQRVNKGNQARGLIASDCKAGYLSWLTTTSKCRIEDKTNSLTLPCANAHMSLPSLQ